MVKDTFNFKLFKAFLSDNVVDGKWECEIWSYSNSELLDGNIVYNVLNNSNVLPIVEIDASLGNPVDFKRMMEASHKEADAALVASYKYACRLNYKD